MNRWTVPLLALLLGLSPWTARASGDPMPTTRSERPSGERTESKPRIRVVAETLNLGDIAQGETGETLFEFYNDGDAPLEIVEVKSS